MQHLKINPVLVSFKLKLKARILTSVYVSVKYGLILFLAWSSKSAVVLAETLSCFEFAINWKLLNCKICELRKGTLCKIRLSDLTQHGADWLMCPGTRGTAFSSNMKNLSLCTDLLTWLDIVQGWYCFAATGFVHCWR